MKQKLVAELLLASLGLAGCAGMSAIPEWGADITAVTESNRVVTFSHMTPGTLETSKPITGLAAGEQVAAISYRSTDGKLYGLGTLGHLYLLDAASGQAQAKSSLHAASGDAYSTLAGKAFGMSFSPLDGMLSVVSDAGQSLSVDADSGAVTTQKSLSDKFNVFAAAYTTKPNGPFKTTLYVISSTHKGEIDSILSATNPMPVMVGALGSDVATVGGLDIRGNEAGGVAWAAMAGASDKDSKLYRVKLGAGEAKGAGTIGGGEKIRGLAIRNSLDS
jgi:hypothetical protein